MIEDRRVRIISIARSKEHGRGFRTSYHDHTSASIFNRTVERKYGNLNLGLILIFRKVCFEGVPKVAALRNSLRRRCSTVGTFGYGARPASGRGGSAHRLRSGLRPRAADRRPVLGIGAVPPPAAPAGCQSPVSGAGLETQRLVREALSLHARPHAMLFAGNKHRTECLAIQR